jgi:hypothetical protein
MSQTFIQYHKPTNCHHCKRKLTSTVLKCDCKLVYYCTPFCREKCVNHEEFCQMKQNMWKCKSYCYPILSPEVQDEIISYFSNLKIEEHDLILLIRRFPITKANQIKKTIKKSKGSGYMIYDIVKAQIIHVCAISELTYTDPYSSEAFDPYINEEHSFVNYATREGFDKYFIPVIELISDSINIKGEITSLKHTCIIKK